MSKYYKINGLKVRVSDHEANTKLNGSSDVYFYTKSADNRKLCVATQVEAYCEKHNLEIALFQEVLNDYPMEVYVPLQRDTVDVSEEFISKYREISGKNSTKRKAMLCAEYGYDAYLVSQGRYNVV